MSNNFTSDEANYLLDKIQKEYARIAFEEPSACLRLKALSLLEKSLLSYQEKGSSIVEVKK